MPVQIDSDIKSIILKHALKNAYDYGKANPKAVLGKVLAERPELKSSVKELTVEINNICEQVNLLEKNEIELRMKNFSYIEKPKEENLYDKLKLPNAEEFISKGYTVTTRFPPEPNGYLHIGHAKAAFLGYESAKLYKGNFIVRFDDTNPEKESQEFVDEILEDLAWLGIKYDKLLFASDHLEYIYSVIKKMFEIKLAYVCTCNQETIKSNRELKKECKCRERSVDENLEFFEKMLKNYFAKGEVCIRLVGDMKSENTAMRDPMLARIIDKEHYRQGSKYILWPTYDLEAPVMDTFNRVTHAIRSKEYELRDESYRYILKRLGSYIPEIVSISRLEVIGYPMSKRIIKDLISKKIVNGWDDIRLPTIKAVRKRGILPLAIKNVVLQFGFSKVDSLIKISRILDENSKLANDIAKRLFFVKDPIKAKILNLGDDIKKVIEIPLHPTLDKGKRIVNVSNEVYISRADLNLFEEKNIVRLKELCYAKFKAIQKNELVLEAVNEKELSSDILKSVKKIQWVSAFDEESYKCTIIEPKELFLDKEFTQLNSESLIFHKGLVEKYVNSLQKDEIIQFERFGYCKFDTVKKENQEIVYEFIYLSQ